MLNQWGRVREPSSPDSTTIPLSQSESAVVESNCHDTTQIGNMLGVSPADVTKATGTIQKVGLFIMTAASLVFVSGSASKDAPAPATSG
jgi:hypothetical protein